MYGYKGMNNRYQENDWRKNKEKKNTAYYTDLKLSISVITIFIKIVVIGVVV